MIRTQKNFLQQADYDLQELSWTIACLTCQKMSCWENNKSQHSKYLIFSTECWMSWRLWKHREFMTEEEKELFRTSSLTTRKWRASTQSESESETSTKRSTGRRFNDNESLFNMSTESSNMTVMNLFQQEQDESSRTEQAQEKQSKSQEEDSRSMSSSSNMISQQ